MIKPVVAGSPVPPPLLYGGAILLGLLIDHVAGLAPLLLLPGNWQLALALALCAFGFALLLGAFGRFRREGTAVEPWKPTSVIVTDGIYGYTRNPMYLGFAIAYIGIALAFASTGALVLLLPVLLWMNGVQIPREEAYLQKRFGNDFTAYRAKVRRWI